MVYLLSQFFSFTSNTIALVFLAEFALLVLYTHWMVTRHRARQSSVYPEIYLIVDNT